MWHFLHLAALPAAFLLGVFCVLTAIMVYPGEEGKIQSKFEDFWIRVDDYKKLALSRHAAFMTQVAQLETRFLDRVFGHKLFSFQSVGVSACLSLAAMFLSLLVLVETNPLAASVTFAEKLKFILPFIVGPLAVALAFMFVTNPLARVILFVYALGLWVYAVLLGQLGGEMNLANLICASEKWSVVLVGGFLCDVAFIAATRRLIRMAGQMNRFFEVGATIMLTILLAVSLVSPAIYFIYSVRAGKIHSSSVSRYSSAIALTNMFDVLLASLFVLLALLFLIHRALWPVLTRSIFRVQDIGTKGRRGILLMVGLSLLGWCVKLPELARELLKALGKG